LKRGSSRLRIAQFDKFEIPAYRSLGECLNVRHQTDFEAFL
jgi:hypothetical protein